jgi:hypothetical protein
LKVSENRVLRRIYGPQGEEVEGSWRRLRNQKLQNLYDSSNISRAIKPRTMRWTGHVECMGDMRNALLLVGKQERKRPLDVRIILDLGETQWDGVDWVHVAQNRDQWRSLVNTVMNLRVP